MHHEKTKMQLPQIPVNGRIITDYLTSNRFAFGWGVTNGRKNKKVKTPGILFRFLVGKIVKLSGMVREFFYFR